MAAPALVVRALGAFAVGALLVLLAPAHADAAGSLVDQIQAIEVDTRAQMTQIAQSYASFASTGPDQETLRLGFEEARAAIEKDRASALAAIASKVAGDPSNPDVHASATSAREGVAEAKDEMIQYARDVYESASSAVTTTTTATPSPTTTTAPTPTTTATIPSTSTTAPTVTPTTSPPATTSSTAPPAASEPGEPPPNPPSVDDTSPAPRVPPTPGETPTSDQPSPGSGASLGVLAALEVAGGGHVASLIDMHPEPDAGDGTIFGLIVAILRAGIPDSLALPIIDLLTVLRAIAAAFVSGTRAIFWPVAVLGLVGATLERRKRERPARLTGV